MAVEEEDDGGGIPEWVVTFGDMMSLLLTFFIMLVSMSEIKKDEEYQAIVDSLHQQFGHDASQQSRVPGETTNNSPLQAIASTGATRRSNTEEGGSNVESIVGEHLQVRTIRPGTNSTLGVIYFDEDADKLSDANRSDLLKIIPQIVGKPQKIEIRGHTSRKPPEDNDNHQDHWHLAFLRCYHTMHFLMEHGIKRERIRLSSAGATEPIDNGLAPEHRRRNARVEILMWDERVADHLGEQG